MTRSGAQRGGAARRELGVSPLPPLEPIVPSVNQTAPRSISPSTLGAPSQKPQQLAAAAQAQAIPGSRDEFVSASASASAKPAAGGKTLRATVDEITNKGARNQMTTGKITVNGHAYTYRSGGHGKGN